MATIITKDKNGLDAYKVQSKRPIRDTIIGQDDITNLKIALETSKTFAEFLRRV